MEKIYKSFDGKNILRRVICIVAISVGAIVVPLTSVAQKCATTEYGEEVILYDDGTWEVVGEGGCESMKKGGSDGSGEVTEVVIGDERYRAGKEEVVFKNLSYNMEAQVVDKNGEALLVLWVNKNHSCSSNEFASPGVSHDRDARVFLSGGGVIRFIDRGKKGVNKMAGLGGCRHYIMYDITYNEVDQIKGKSIKRILIKDGWGGTDVYRVNRNERTLSRQIKALGL